MVFSIDPCGTVERTWLQEPDALASTLISMIREIYKAVYTHTFLYACAFSILNNVMNEETETGPNELHEIHKAEKYRI